MQNVEILGTMEGPDGDIAVFYRYAGTDLYRVRLEPVYGPDSRPTEDRPDAYTAFEWAEVSAVDPHAQPTAIHTLSHVPQAVRVEINRPVQTPRQA